MNRKESVGEFSGDNYYIKDNFQNLIFFQFKGVGLLSPVHSVIDI